MSPAHRGGSGPPLVLLHGFTDTWRTWELVLAALEGHFDVLAPTLPGHAGGPPLPEPFTQEKLLDAVEQVLDDAGLRTAHLVGNSLGAFAALGLAARGRARSVLALAPAGGWAEHDDLQRQTLRFFLTMQGLVKQAAAQAEAIASTAEGRRRATEFSTVRFEHIPAELVAHQIRGAAHCPAVIPMIEHARAHGWSLQAERIACPVRIAWGTEDRILPLPASAVRFRQEWLAAAEWLELEGVGHCPQLDVPGRTAKLILESAGAAPAGARDAAHLR